jgi:hypothetical protein
MYALATQNVDELVLLNIEKRYNELLSDKRWDVSHAREFSIFFDKFKKSDITLHSIKNIEWGFQNIEYIKDAQYIGYFQSEKYFKKYRKDILNLFDLPLNIRTELDKKYSHLYNRTVIHVRRGDYLNDQNNHVVMDMDYFNNAMSYFDFNNKYVVFSSDIEWCKQNFIKGKFEFIEEKDYCEIYLMSKMKNFIISNSTFSWWGAWLSESENKKIIAPKKWFGPNLNHLETKDIYCDNWIII